MNIFCEHKVVETTYCFHCDALQPTPLILGQRIGMLEKEDISFSLCVFVCVCVNAQLHSVSCTKVMCNDLEDGFVVSLALLFLW